MPLINCPNCNNPVSDKAIACPNCNYCVKPEKSETKVTCEDCKNEFDGNLSACPLCGCPTPKQTKKRRKIIISVSILLIILFITTVGITSVNKYSLEMYGYNIIKTANTMLDGAAKSENIGNLTKSVWNNAIYNKRDENTDKYTMENGKFVDDFNDALGNLFEDEEFRKAVSEIRDNQNEVAELMKTLKNPPKKYEESYSVLKEYYDNYIKLTNLAMNPTGSLKSFSEDFNTYDTETVNSYQKMKLYMD